MRRNALRLQKLVNTLLDFARIEAGRVTARYEPTDLAASTRELASMFRAATERAGIELRIDAPPLAEPVHVDRDMWEKIVLNLLSNALKFTFEGSITIRLRAVDGRAELSVSDTGTGIPEAELPHLFERFHRVHGAASRTHEGSGIGLALVGALVYFHPLTIPAGQTIGYLAVAIALVLLPQFAGNGWVFLGIMALAALWWATGLRARLRRGDAGPNYAEMKGL